MGKILELEKRKEIERLLNKGHSVGEVAQQLGIHITTIYRDKKKCNGAYVAEEAHANTCKGYHPIDFEIIGKKFGLLTVLEYTNQIQKNRTFWKCQCDCGNITYFSRKILADYCSPERPLSCGCIAKESKGCAGKVPIEESALRKYQDLLTFRKIEGRCWIWTGYVQKTRIPRTSWKNKAMSVRKCIYLLMNGITYESTPTHASCRNYLCFNPEHVVLGKPPKNWYLD